VGVLAVASVSLRRARRVRRRELRQTEQDLTAEVDELERENRALRDQLANYRQSRRPAGAAMPADRPPEPVYDEARRVARLHGSDPNR
jgi:cell division protein FtsB